MEISEIQKYLPHRYPFLLVDRVLELKIGESIVAVKNVSINESFFQGHFPCKAIMPGVLILEAMAQAAGILGFRTLGESPEDGSTYLFVGADDVRFRRQVVPGDQLILKVNYVSDRRGMWKFACECLVDGELAASASIICAYRTL